MPQEQSQQRIESLLFYGAVLLIFYLAYRVVEPFLQPLGWAVVLVVCVFPLHQRLRKRWGPMRAAALSTLFVTLLLVVPALALTSGLVNQAWSAVHHIQSAGEQPAQFPPSAQQALDWLSQHGVPGIETDPLKMAREAATWVAHWLADRAGEALRNAASVALKLLILLFALFFLFRDGPALVARTRNVLPFDDAQRDALVGLPSPIFWGALMGLLSLLPVIGGWLVWGPAVLWLAVNGEYGRAVVLVCICAGVAGTLEHFVRPLLLSGKTQMNSLLILVSVLGGISVFGFLGFILGPIVVALASTILNVYTSPPGEVATVE